VHALEGDGAGPTRYKHGRGIWWREFDGGVRRRETEQSSCPRPPTRRRERQQALAGGTPVRAPGHRSKFEHTVVTRRARRIRPGGF